MKIEKHIAFKYLKSKKRSGFISYTTVISIFGLILGTAALIISVSVLNGFEEIVVEKFMGVESHLRIFKPGSRGFTDYENLVDKIKLYEDVKGVSPYVSEKVMLINEDNYISAILKGVDEKSVDSVNDLSENIILGSINFNSGLGVYPPVVMGKLLADRLGVSVNDVISILSPAGMRNIYSPIPVRKFEVIGIFENGIAEFDNVFVFTALAEGQKFLKLQNMVSGLEVKLTSRDDVSHYKNEFEKILDKDFQVYSWENLHRSLYISMKLEKYGTLIVLSLIILVASFNIVSSLTMMILEKKREIGILLSMGLSDKGIQRIFMWQGFIIGGFGIFVGIIFGLVSCVLIDKFQLLKLPEDVYIISAMPVKMNPFDFVLIGIIGFTLALFSSFYPAWKASKLDPVESLRYE